jgi:hypothetical protein
MHEIRLRQRNASTGFSTRNGPQALMEWTDGRRGSTEMEMGFHGRGDEGPPDFERIDRAV